MHYIHLEKEIYFYIYYKKKKSNRSKWLIKKIWLILTDNKKH